MAKQKIQNNPLQHLVLRLTRVHFLYVAAYMLAIIIFDSWNLLAHEAVVQRWTLVAGLLFVNIAIWYASRLKVSNQAFCKALLITLLTADIIFAAVNVYWQRGMASKEVMLFVVPIIAAGLARSRSLLLGVTALSVGAYSLAAVKYFHENYGQGFRVQLYGEIFFYGALMFVLAYMMMIGFRSAKE